MTTIQPINAAKTTPSTYLIEYYTTGGMIHFAWIVRAINKADAREQVKRLRNFSEVITCEESHICPLACPSNIIHMVQ